MVLLSDLYYYGALIPFTEWTIGGVFQLRIICIGGDLCHPSQQIGNISSARALIEINALPKVSLYRIMERLMLTLYQPR